MHALQGYGDSDSDSEESSVALPQPGLPKLPRSAAIASSSDDDDDDDDATGRGDDGSRAKEVAAAEPASAAPAEAAVSLLPSIDDVFDSVETPAFLAQPHAPPDGYGDLLETEEEQAPGRGPPPKRAREEECEDGALGRAPSGPPMPARAAEAPRREKETTRQKNKRKQARGQANFTLKWDRDCGAEKAGT